MLKIGDKFQYIIFQVNINTFVTVFCSCLVVVVKEPYKLAIVQTLKKAVFYTYIKNIFFVAAKAMYKSKTS
jgi:uncharacterized MnhB-related membrane protein